MKPDKDLANDIIVAMAKLYVENLIMKLLLENDPRNIEKLLANAKTDRGLIRDALQVFAPLRAELKEVDSLEELVELCVQTHPPPSGEVN